MHDPMIIRPIETEWMGCHFRSRTEARWAVCFEAIGWKWEYEPQGYHTAIGGYLPDFWLPEQKCYIEIKPDRELSDTELIKALYLATDAPVMLLRGQPQTPQLNDRRVVSGSIATCFARSVHPTTGPWDETTVIGLVTKLLGTAFPQAMLSFRFTDEGPVIDDVCDDSGNTIFDVCYDADYNGDPWRIYRVPNVQLDGFSWVDQFAIHRKTGTVVHVMGRPYLIHEWRNGDVHFWCYPEYVPRDQTNIRGFTSGKYRKQQSVARVDTPRLKNAYRLARSARFEHGEQPKVPRGKPRR